MSFQQMTLPTTTEPGYGGRELPVDEMVKLNSDSRPTLVWFFSQDDESANRNVEGTVFGNEQIGLALKKFRCLKIDVESIKSGKLRREYGQTPSFVMYDPTGSQVARLQGKSASSLSRFSGLVKHTWAKVFTVRQRDFVRSMTKILNRLDRLNTAQTALAGKKQRAQAKGHRAKLAAITREEEKLEQQKAAIEKDEEQVLQSCALKKAFVQREEVAAAD